MFHDDFLCTDTTQTADFLGTDRHAELLCHTKQSHLVISFPQPYFIAIRDEMFTGT
jgi:hypothetical protein